MSLRELLNAAYSAIQDGRSPTAAEEFHRELYAEPGTKARPVSRGTKSLMAMMGMPPTPPPRPREA